MSSNDDLQNKLREGVEKARSGDRLVARRLLEEVVEQDPGNEMGWLWLASCVNTVVERRACLQHVLEINPNNERAKEALRRLTSSASTTAAAPVTTTQEMRATTRESITSSLRAREEATSPRRGQASSGGGGGLSMVSVLIILGVIASFAFIGFMAVTVINDLNPATPTPTETEVPLVAIGTNPVTNTPPPTITPEFTRTLISLNEITPLATLPPTFTPTFTPSPSPTFTPSPEPLPLDTFEMVSVSLSRGNVQPDAYTMRGDGENVRDLVSEAREIAFSPDGEQIAFIRDIATGSEIFIADINEPEEARQLTSFGVSDTSHPSWSPDGERLVFSSSGNLAAEDDAPEDASLIELWVINADGTNLQQLTSNNFLDIEPSWSPMDNRVVFTSGSGSGLSLQTHIVVIDVDRLIPEDELLPRYNQLTTTPNNYSPSWSFDGSQIAFISDRFGDGDVWVMDDEGFSRNLITVEDGTAEDTSPVISPDGRWIAFVSNREDDRFQTYMISFDGIVVERISNNQREDESIIFRPTELELPE